MHAGFRFIGRAVRLFEDQVCAPIRKDAVRIGNDGQPCRVAGSGQSDFA